MNKLIYGMIYLGSALMIFNVFSYIRYAQQLQKDENWGRERNVLYAPIFLLVLFLLGYLAVGIFGDPDLIISGILFGGSIFVFIIFRFLQFVTGRVRENERLEARLMAAEENSKVKTAFLASVSHEMRTPMNAIIGLDTIALKNPALPDETRVQLEKIGVSAHYLLDLINNVLDMNNMDAGQITLRSEPFPLPEMLDLIDTMIRSQCDEKGLLYRSSVIGSINDYYIGDGPRLRHVLLNILENAVKFTPPSGSVIFTTEQIRGDDHCCVLRFTVRDTGIGIGRESLPKIFEPFSQEDTSSTNSNGGSGLGLAFAKKIVDLMEGEIAVSSEKGQGSEFRVTVTMGRSEQKASDMPEQTGSGFEQDIHAALKGSRVLITEDIDLNAEILADLLDMEEVRTERAENGQIAVDKFSQSPEYYYDAILMDLRMPVMDGFEAARNIRALDRPDAKTVPIIALTANASEEDRQNSLRAGMNSHLAKPAEAEVLNETLGRLIARYRKTE